MEEDKYTETSWAVLQTRLADAQEALEETKQTIVDKAVEKAENSNCSAGIKRWKRRRKIQNMSVELMK